MTPEQIKVCRYCGRSLKPGEMWDCVDHIGWFEAAEARRAILENQP